MENQSSPSLNGILLVTALLIVGTLAAMKFTTTATNQAEYINDCALAQFHCDKLTESNRKVALTRELEISDRVTRLDKIKKAQNSL
jgi:hypothetical protein